MVSATSCTRRIAAPRDSANRPAASEPGRRRRGVLLAGDRPEERFARDADQDRAAEQQHSSGSRRSNSTDCSAVLAKPMPGSMAILSRAMPARSAAAIRSAKFARHLGRDVVVARLGIHVGRSCRACASARPGSRARRPAAPPPGRAPSAETSLTMAAPASSAAAMVGGVAGVHRDAQARRGKARITGRMRRCSSAGGVGCDARPRALAADVDDVGPGRGHRQAGGDRGARVKEVAAVAEAVGRDVQHAHDPRAVQRQAGPVITSDPSPSCCRDR